MTSSQKNKTKNAPQKRTTKMSREAYYRQHEDVVSEDVMTATKAKDYVGAAKVLFEYGQFLQRHPEALKAVSRG